MSVSREAERPELFLGDLRREELPATIPGLFAVFGAKEELRAPPRIR
jgi:hypothetical protein